MIATIFVLFIGAIIGVGGIIAFLYFFAD